MQQQSNFVSLDFKVKITYLFHIALVHFNVMLNKIFTQQ